MKKVILSIILITVAVSATQAQTYSQNKLKYDYHQYVKQYGDPYDPALSGVCSFLIPGLGQMLANETGRGFAFMGASAGCGFLTLLGYGTFISSALNGNGSGVGGGAGIMLLGMAGMLTVNIWSIVDAVHVAQVNNLYIRDLQKKSELKFELEPYVARININNQITTPVGMTMRVRF
jgi:TM2 domain-containing membrane protein YozV